MAVLRPYKKDTKYGMGFTFFLLTRSLHIQNSALERKKVANAFDFQNAKQKPVTKPVMSDMILSFDFLSMFHGNNFSTMGTPLPMSAMDPKKIAKEVPEVCPAYSLSTMSLNPL